MTGERWQQIQDVFNRVVECPPDQRDSLLQEHCANDLELRQEVETLLECDAPDECLVKIPLEFSALAATEPDMSGSRIGVYRLIRLIGHGGMSAVYLGVRDDDQYQKQVAIKLLKRGMDTDFLLSRFRQERQILANLEHPFISRLIDGGATEDGLPYLVMEYVDGLPITKYCADRNLSIDERLRLFQLVCEAVQYAHQNLVVHRDIKPGNILTTKEGVPKLLDFGIAKVLDQGLRSGVTLTQRELRMLTPDYASPEQVRGAQISTASDIYSLGAVLYELLSLQRPHQFPSDAITDLERTICETEPQKPSVAASRNKALPPPLRDQLRRQLEGDLDNIILAALRKEPQRRYASAAEFSQDLKRHQEALPVHAREDRWTYRTSKFIRRNRLAAGAAALLAASLVAGIVTTTLQARRAERRFELARQLAKAVVADIKGPLTQLPGSTAVRASMIQTVLGYLDGLAKDPRSDPEFDLEIADTYREVASIEAHPFRANLGQTAAALDHYQRSIGIYSRLINRPETKVHALGGVIGANIEAGDIELRTGNTATALARLQRVAAMATEATARDSKAIMPGTWAYLYFRLGDVEMRNGAPDQALIQYRAALDVSQKWAASTAGSNPRVTLRGSYSRVAQAQKASGDLYGARDNYATAVQGLEDTVQQNDAVMFERSMLGYAHQALASLLGNPDELNLGERARATSHARAAVAIFTNIAAADSRDVRARDDLAGGYRALAAILREDHEIESLEWHQKAEDMSKSLMSGDPANSKFRYDSIMGLTSFATLLHRAGRDTEALEKLNTARAIIPELLKTSPEKGWIADLTKTYRDRGDVLLATRDEAGALDEFRKALEQSESLSAKAPANMHFRMHYADSLASLGRYYATLARRDARHRSDARLWLQKSLALWKDCTSRRVAMPFAATRERQVADILASVDKIPAPFRSR